MSFQIVVADDEVEIRDGIADLLSQEMQGVEIVAKCQNGLQVMEYISKHGADLVITDIRMPQIDGLEVAKALKQGKQIPVIIITAHRNFEYAQTALHYGVTKLITKPIDFDLLIESVQEIIQKSEQNKEIRAEQQKTIELLAHRSYQSRQLFYYLSGKCNFDELKGVFDETATYLENASCAVAEYKVKPWNKVSIPRNAWQTMSETDDKEISVFCLREDAKGALLLIFFKKIAYSVCETAANEFTVKIKELIQKAYGLDTESTVSCYKKLSDIVIENTRTTVLLYVDYLVNNNSSALNDLQETITKAFGFDWLQSFTCAVIYHLNVTIETDMSYYISRVNHASSKEELCNILSEIRKSFSQNSDNKIYQIKNYVSNHYREDISLIRIADVFSLNPTYLSRMFKKATGENFVDYIQRFKIETSKELLIRSKLSVREISEQLGYSSVGYFSKVFKTATGMTPKQFRQMAGEN